MPISTDVSHWLMCLRPFPPCRILMGHSHKLSVVSSPLCVYNLLLFQLGSLQTYKIDTTLSSETLVPICPNTRCHIQKFDNLSARTIIPDYTCNEGSCRKICANRAECQLQDKLLRIVEVLSELFMNIPLSAIHLFQLNH